MAARKPRKPDYNGSLADYKESVKPASKKNAPAKQRTQNNTQIPNEENLNPVFQERLNRLVTENPSIKVAETIRTESAVDKLFEQRYSKTDSKQNVYDPKIYDKFKAGQLKEYKGDVYKLKPGNAPAAVPGASFHSSGLAADLTGNVNLASKISSQYGLENIMSIGEPWHFQPSGLPQGKRVIDFVKNRYGKDIVANPLTSEALKFVNEKFASNAPAHSGAILSQLDKYIGKPTNPSYGGTATYKQMVQKNLRWGRK